NYLAQIGPLYERFGDLFGDPRVARQPLVVPRARFRCLEDNTRALLHKLGLSAAEAEGPRAEVLRRAGERSQGLREHPDPAAMQARMLGDISLKMDELEAMDPSLRDPVRRARETIERTVARLVERYGKALLERDQVTTERVDRLRGFLFPDE